MTSFSLTGYFPIDLANYRMLTSYDPRASCFKLIMRLPYEYNKCEDFDLLVLRLCFRPQTHNMAPFFQQLKPKDPLI